MIGSSPIIQKIFLLKYRRQNIIQILDAQVLRKDEAKFLNDSCVIKSTVWDLKFYHLHEGVLSSFFFLLVHFNLFDILNKSRPRLTQSIFPAFLLKHFSYYILSLRNRFKYDQAVLNINKHQPNERTANTYLTFIPLVQYSMLILICFYSFSSDFWEAKSRFFQLK